jgi:hypothetical protein
MGIIRRRTSYSRIEEIGSERRQLERYTPPDFHSSFSFSITDDDPITVREAVDSKDGKLWKKAMVEEMETLYKNVSWDLVELSSKKNLVCRKWMFKNKLNA